MYKALKSIRRFSEDIDLTVRVNDCSSKSQAKKRLEQSSTRFKSLPRDKENPMNINSKGSITAIYSYNTFLPSLEPDALQRFGILKVETTSFTVSEPTHTLEIEPILYTMSTEDVKLKLNEFGVKPFYIETVAIERIFVDKILAAEFYAERENMFDVAKHTYDLTVLMQVPEIQELLQNDSEFIRMLSYKRMEETVRIGSSLATKSLKQLDFFDILSKPTFIEAYEKMQLIYVINSADIISHSELISNLTLLKEYLNSVSEKEQKYLASIEYTIEKSRLIKQTQYESERQKNPRGLDELDER